MTFNKKTQIFIGLLLLHWWIIDVVLAFSSDWTEIIWFTSTAFLLGGIALLTNNSYLLSVQVIIALPLEGLWIIDYLIYLASGHFPFGYARYMIDPLIPALDQYIGIAHLFLLPLLLIAYKYMHFHVRALIGAAIQAAIIIPLAYFFSSPEENVNCAFALCGQSGFTFGTPLMHVLIWFVVVVVACFIPSTWLLYRLKKKNKCKNMLK